MIKIRELAKEKTYLLLFILILILGIFLRFHKLGEIPNSLNWDEASWGYNSYSILLTGKDEHGSFFPTSFKAFGDYKQPIYVYLGTIPIKIFGLSPYGVRFTSALFGSLSIGLVFLLAKELFKKEKFNRNISLLSMFFFALSPWSIQFSRVAYEANLGLFFVLLGVWIYLKGMNENKIAYFLLSIVPLTLSAYTYHSLKIFTPFLVVFLLIFTYKYIKFNKKIILIFSFLFIFCNIFWIMDLRTTARGRSVTFFSNSTEILKSSVENRGYYATRNDILGRILNDRRIVFFNKYLENYFAHYDLNYLFVKGDNARHHAPSFGLLYLINLPLIVLGIYFLIFKKNSYALILFAWFLMAPIASSLALDSPNSSRSLVFLPTWDIFAAAGVVFIAGSFKNKKMILSALVFLFLVNFIYYVHQYFSHTNIDTAPYWQYGYKEAVEYSESFKNTDKKIFYLSDIEQGYIFYLFYNKYDPEIYLSRGGSNRTKEECYSIDKSYFGKCESKMRNGDLIVTTQGNISPHSLYKSEVIKSFKSKNLDYQVNVAELKL